MDLDCPEEYDRRLRGYAAVPGNQAVVKLLIEWKDVDHKYPDQD